MNRYITCIIKNESKQTKIYESESYKDLLKLIKSDNIGDYKLKYARKMNLDGNHHFGINISAKAYQNLL